jgi:hypothetical protein
MKKSQNMSIGPSTLAQFAEAGKLA